MGHYECYVFETVLIFCLLCQSIRCCCFAMYLLAYNILSLVVVSLCYAMHFKRFKGTVRVLVHNVSRLGAACEKATSGRDERECSRLAC